MWKPQVCIYEYDYDKLYSTFKEVFKAPVLMPCALDNGMQNTGLNKSFFPLEFARLTWLRYSVLHPSFNCWSDLLKVIRVTLGTR